MKDLGIATKVLDGLKFDNAAELGAAAGAESSAWLVGGSGPELGLATTGTECNDACREALKIRG